MAGGLGKGHIGQQRRQRRADGRRDTGGEHHRVEIHARLGQEIRVDEDDVRHGKKGRKAACDLFADGGAMLLQLEHFLHETNPSIFLVRVAPRPYFQRGRRPHMAPVRKQKSGR